MSNSKADDSVKSVDEATGKRKIFKGFKLPFLRKNTKSVPEMPEEKFRRRSSSAGPQDKQEPRRKKSGSVYEKGAGIEPEPQSAPPL